MADGVVFSSPFPAAPIVGEDLQQQEGKQQELRFDTQNIAQQLGGLADEFERNGLPGEDGKVVEAIQAALGQISRQDMEQVLAHLRQARLLSGDNAARQAMGEAFSGQKIVVVKLRQLVAQHERRRTLFYLAARAAELEQRQATNLQAALALFDSTRGVSLGRFTEAQNDALRLQIAEQRTLQAEAQQLALKLDTLARRSENPETTALCRQAMAGLRQGQFMPVLELASACLQEGRLLPAAGAGQRAREMFRALGRLLTAARAPLGDLAESLRNLNGVIRQQQQMLARTAELGQTSNPDPGELGIAQAGLVARTDLLRRDLAEPAPSVANALRAAQDKMGKARTLLSAPPPHLPPRRPGWEGPEGDLMRAELNRRRAAALPLQQAGLTQMEEARRVLQDQISRAESLLAAAGEHPLARLKEWQKEMRELQARQAQLAAAPPQSIAQSPLREQARSLQNRVAPHVPQAAQTLAQAAHQMERAEQYFSPEPGLGQWRQAVRASLAQADRQLDREINRLEQAKMDLASLEGAMAKLGQLLEQQQQVQLQTVRQTNSSPGADWPELSVRQIALGERTGELRQALEEMAPNAAYSLQAAGNTMAAAGAKLEQSDRSAAQAGQGRVLQDLCAARQAIEYKMLAVKKLLGQNTTPSTARAPGQSVPGASALAMNGPSPHNRLPGLAQGQNQDNRTGQGPAQGLGNCTGPSLLEGERRMAQGPGQFVGLSPRERAALQQSQRDKYPPEFGVMVEQYFSNLAEPVAATPSRQEAKREVR